MSEGDWVLLTTEEHTALVKRVEELESGEAYKLAGAVAAQVNQKNEELNREVSRLQREFALYRRDATERIDKIFLTASAVAEQADLEIARLKDGINIAHALLEEKQFTGARHCLRNTQEGKLVNNNGQVLRPEGE